MRKSNKGTKKRNTTIYLKNGIWYFNFMFNKKRYNFSTNAKTENEALEIEKNAREQLKKGYELTRVKGGIFKPLEKTKLNYECETFLPCFSGYYETLIGNIDDNLNEDYFFNDVLNIKTEYIQKVLELAFDNIDYKNLYIEISKDLVNFWNEKLKEDNLQDKLKIEFIKLNSPKEYNFKTDIIEVKAFFNDDLVKFLTDYCINNKDAFTQYLEDKFKSRSGFISFYNHNYDYWMQILKDFNFNDFYHLGSFMDFYYSNEDLKNDSLVNDQYDYIYEKYFSNGYFDSYINYNNIIAEFNKYYFECEVLSKLKEFENELFKLKLENNINYETVMKEFNKIGVEDFKPIENLSDLEGE